MERALRFFRVGKVHSIKMTSRHRHRVVASSLAPREPARDAVTLRPGDTSLNIVTCIAAMQQCNLS
jgi:hypothetical protein